MTYNLFSGRNVERILLVADGVFAVAMTLLVLDLRLPAEHAADDHALWSQLAGLAPQVAAYALSFTMLRTFWLAVHTSSVVGRELAKIGFGSARSPLRARR